MTRLDSIFSTLLYCDSISLLVLSEYGQCIYQCIQMLQFCFSCGLSAGYKWRILRSVFGIPIAELAQGLAYRVQHFCNNWALLIIIFDLFWASLCLLLRKWLFSVLLLSTFCFHSSSYLLFLVLVPYVFNKEFLTWR